MKERKIKLEDPVEAGEQAENEDIGDAFDLSKITAAPLSDEVAKTPKPFDGYPLKFTQMEADGKKHRVCATFLVAHNHIADPIRQDPANRKVKGGDGKMHLIRTCHNRSIRDVLNGPHANEAVWFDRPIKLANGTFFCAVVPCPYVRSQLLFKHNTKNNSVETDKRYLLLDTEQANRLKQCFQQVINPNIRIEQAAKYYSGESTDAVEAPEG
ncbi:MAG: hypothetical protein WC637_00305 [Victivallales bacterium]|jgi:hypothetical protein